MLFQGVAAQETGLPCPNPSTGGAFGWELTIHGIPERSVKSRGLREGRMSKEVKDAF